MPDPQDCSGLPTGREPTTLRWRSIGCIEVNPRHANPVERTTAGHHRHR
jgi:hypothetical protein